MTLPHPAEPRPAAEGPRWGEGESTPEPAALPKTRGSSRRRGCLVLAVIALLALGHYAYWYQPRPRAASLRAGSFAADLLAAGDYEACLWLPYPHQNLGALADEVGEVDRYLAAVGEVTGLPDLRVPGFGPFRAPPAREVVVASSGDGAQWVVAAQVYPVLAVLARLSGKLASNPWLAGGEVRLSDRPARVRWTGRLWLLESVDGAGGGKAASRSGGRVPLPEGSALARLILRQPQGLLPAGKYRLREEGDALELTGDAARPWGGAAPLLDAPDLVAVVFSGGQAARAALLLDQDGSKTKSFSIPNAAVLSRPGGERWRLPGEGLLQRLRGGLATGEAGGWQVVAFNQETLGRALEVGELLAPMAQQGDSAPAWAIWLRPGAAARMVEGIADALEAIPLIGRQRAGRWRAWSTVLEPLRDRERLTVEIGRREGEVRFRLQ